MRLVDRKACVGRPIHANDGGLFCSGRHARPRSRTAPRMGARECLLGSGLPRASSRTSISGILEPMGARGVILTPDHHIDLPRVERPHLPRSVLTALARSSGATAWSAQNAGSPRSGTMALAEHDRQRVPGTRPMTGSQRFRTPAPSGDGVGDVPHRDPCCRRDTRGGRRECFG